MEKAVVKLKDILLLGVFLKPPPPPPKDRLNPPPPPPDSWDRYHRIRYLLNLNIFLINYLRLKNFPRKVTRIAKLHQQLTAYETTLNSSFAQRTSINPTVLLSFHLSFYLLQGT